MAGDQAGGGGFVRRVRGSRTAQARLVCLPHAGGVAGFFNSWARRLPDDVELLSIQYPGRQDRFAEPCISRMDDLVPRIVESLSSYTDLPLMLFGHSMGAWVAFEAALLMERYFPQGVSALFVSGQTPPHLGKQEPMGRDSDEELIAELQRIGGTDEGVVQDTELWELLLPAVRADFELVDSYGPRPLRTIGAPVFAYVGESDPDVRVEDVRRWAEATRGGFRLREYPGGHFYLSAHEAQVVSDLMCDSTRFLVAEGAGGS